VSLKRSDIEEKRARWLLQYQRSLGIYEGTMISAAEQVCGRTKGPKTHKERRGFSCCM